jgi:acetone carboxylase, beta subunit
MKRKKRAIPIYTLSDIQSVWREASRLNCTVIEAYAAAPSRENLASIENKLRGNGFKNKLQIMTAHGGISNIQTAKAFRSLISGPIGGIIGSRSVGPTLDNEDRFNYRNYSGHLLT